MTTAKGKTYFFDGESRRFTQPEFNSGQFCSDQEAIAAGKERGADTVYIEDPVTNASITIWEEGD